VAGCSLFSERPARPPWVWWFALVMTRSAVVLAAWTAPTTQRPRGVIVTTHAHCLLCACLLCPPSHLGDCVREDFSPSDMPLMGCMSECCEAP